MKVKYEDGPDAVDVHLGDGKWARVERGKPIDVEDDAVAKQLVEQGWDEVRSTTKIPVNREEE